VGSWDAILIAGAWIIGAASVLLSVMASAHVVLYKRDSRSAVLWVILVWMMPIAGAASYYLFGINRIRRHAASLRGGQEKHLSVPSVEPCPPETVDHHLPEKSRHLSLLAQLVHKVVQRPLVSGNRVQPLYNGDEAFPAMLEAIGQARHSISLATYIFDNDPVGREFANALSLAVQRGVEVRVLIDDAGLRYSWPTIRSSLAQSRVPTARFLPSLAPWKLTTMNLRNHRKILVIDGHLGFTGGMNIRAGHWLSRFPNQGVQDLQFKVEGPVVAHLQEAFVDDWSFTTGETLRGDIWFPRQVPCGPVLARGISDGPDEDFEKLRWTLLGALTAAHHRIVVVTPYFLPDQAIISALNLAVMRGVEVEILLPETNNFTLVQWATQAILWQVLERGCRIWMTPGPFDHSKALLVDDYWSLIGSANWDPRSLRLNFEFNLECYDAELAVTLRQWIERKQARSRPLTLADVDGRSIPVRLRDGLARLLAPFM
jgi:cardiolipin synthase A/B